MYNFLTPLYKLMLTVFLISSIGSSANQCQGKIIGASGMTGLETLAKSESSSDISDLDLSALKNYKGIREYWQ